MTRQEQHWAQRRAMLADEEVTADKLWEWVAKYSAHAGLVAEFVRLYGRLPNAQG